ncbi:inositol -trisphosphate receptor-interacting 1 [Limosa lapponica baueri]|uniref:Inositol-trisphosphate receptor-interacting 1 n=1 Tax=Limosa lapponica baueri TaxID=1758121 RepID=A0A2I0TYS7_LIMLA|nr:inositol -trisphosphate receptor-interacting 1 [Limosa lapponica baueri]
MWYLRGCVEEKRLDHFFLGNENVPEDIILPPAFQAAEPLNLFQHLVQDPAAHATALRIAADVSDAAQAHGPWVEDVNIDEVSGWQLLRGWCVIGNVIDPFNAMILGPGANEAVSEMSPVAQLNSLWGTMSPQDLLFKAQDGVAGGGMGHRIHLNHFNFSSPIHLLVVLMFLSGLTLGYTGIYMMYFHNRTLYPGNNILPQFSSPDRSLGIEGLQSDCNLGSQTLVLMGDFKHPNICWRDNTTGHKKSRKFLESVDHNFILQMVEPPMRRGAMLDLVLTSKEGLVENVKLEGRLGHSDHEMVEFKMSGK